jgi:hypothetical protein
MRHGYYIASIQQSFGDPEFADAARALWGERVPTSKYDGASIFTRPDGSVISRTVQVDFSTTPPTTSIQDHA